MFAARTHSIDSMHLLIWPVQTLAPNMKRTTLETVHDLLVKRQKSMEECVIWARQLFEKWFVNDIKQLIWQFPADFKDPKTGAPFWSGAKRPPSPANFDPHNDLHVNFVVAAAFLRAWNVGVVHGMPSLCRLLLHMSPFSPVAACRRVQAEGL